MHRKPPPAPAPHHSTVPAAFVPPARIGLVQLPGSTRHVWWTGRVAIGLRYWPAGSGRAEAGHRHAAD